MEIVIAKGLPSTKQYFFVSKKSGVDVRQGTPFIFAKTWDDYEGFCAAFGPAIHLESPIHENKAMSWGLAGPGELLRSWRAMKLLEKTPEISNYTLCYSWYCAGKDLHPTETHYLDDMAELFSDRRTFEQTRNTILNTIPSDKQLAQMLTVVRDAKISLSDLEEIQKIVAAGAYSLSQPVLADLVKKADEDRSHETCKKAWAEAERAISASKEPSLPGYKSEPSVPDKQNFLQGLRAGIKRHLRV